MVGLGRRALPADSLGTRVECNGGEKMEKMVSEGNIRLRSYPLLILVQDG